MQQKSDKSWVINYKSAVCKFELSSSSDCVIYDLEVPKEKRNEGIGTEIIKFVEKYISKNEDIDTIFVQIGAPTGATKHVLKNKLNYKIVGIEENEVLGDVIDAYKSV